RLVCVENPMREAYRFEYDRAGRVREERTFDGRVLGYQYSKADRLSRMERPDGTWRAFAYDPTGNLVRETSSHGSMTFDRDELGRLVKAVVAEHNGKTVVAFERDELGRVVVEKQGERAILYAYD